MHFYTRRKDLDSILHRTYRGISTLLTNTDNIAAYLLPIVPGLASRYHPTLAMAKVISIKNQNDNIYTITLKPKSRKFKSFKAGQYIQLEVEIDGRRRQRTFSISSAPQSLEQHGIIQISIRHIDDGTVTPWLSKNLRPGSRLFVSQAMGNFVLKTNNRPKLFIAAGSGITPILSMLMQQIQSKPATRLDNQELLYFVPDRQHAGFKEELNKLATSGLKLSVISTQTDGHFSANYITHPKLSIGANLSQSEAYLCGPGAMIESCKDILIKSGINEDNIYFEYFGPALSDKHLQTQEKETSLADRTVLFEKSAISTVAEKTDTRTLLEIAEDSDLKPLSGCRIGVCHQCVCTKKSGRVRNTRTSEISDSGEEEIQLCVSYPLDNISISI